MRFLGGEERSGSKKRVGREYGECGWSEWRKERAERRRSGECEGTREDGEKVEEWRERRKKRGGRRVSGSYGVEKKERRE